VGGEVRRGPVLAAWGARGAVCDACVCAVVGDGVAGALPQPERSLGVALPRLPSLPGQGRQQAVEALRGVPSCVCRGEQSAQGEQGSGCRVEGI
jgi:hypothetical protein